MRPECHVRCTLSLWRTKKEDRKGRREGKGFRDECLLRSLSRSLICVAMREVVWHGAALGFKTWKLVEFLNGQKIISCILVYEIKRDDNDKVE